MMEEESEIENRGRDRSVVNGDARLVQMPSSRSVKESTRCLDNARAFVPDNQDSGIFNELVRFSTRFKIDFAGNGVPQIDLTVDHIGECRSAGVFTPNVSALLVKYIDKFSYLQNRP